MTGTLDTRDLPRPRLLAGLAPRNSHDLWGHHETWGELPRHSAAAVLDEVDASGLLGRGGAGFPTGRKLRTVAAGSRRRVVVANGCEGEPASAKDSLLLARAPHLVLDGVALAARAVGADTAYVVVHASSPGARHLRAALEQRRDDVEVQVAEVPGRYVSSEETAIVSWLDGGEAKPTFTPPRPFERGVRGRPTLVNNVETLAHVATIARRGADWFRELGDPDEPGTLLVSVSGGSVRRAVVEVPTATSVGDVLSAAGADGASPQAVLVGGYFGTWLPFHEAEHLPLSHRSLRAAGGALGAGIVLALPGDRCGLAETARVAEYLAASNAGQCGPCFNGLPAIAGALWDLAHGRWDDRRWPALGRWLDVVPGRGACRHPDGAVRLVVSALRVFADDVERHRSGRPCAAVLRPGWLPVPEASGAEQGWR